MPNQSHSYLFNRLNNIKDKFRQTEISTKNGSQEDSLINPEIRVILPDLLTNWNTHTKYKSMTYLKIYKHIDPKEDEIWKAQ
jgi:hypothetical protein